jgi:type I restriction enzyme, S subunit
MIKKESGIEELMEHALVPEEEQPYKLPANWKWVKSTSLLDIQYGKGLPTTKLISEGYPVFGANGVIGYYSEYTQEVSRVLMTCRGATCGNINVCEPKSFVTNNSLVIKPRWNTEVLFLEYLLKSLDNNVLISGSAQPQITVKAFEKYYLPIPPLKEQKRIAEKVNRLLDKVEEAKQLINETKETFHFRRESILSKAFRGELTRKWREKQNSISNANEFLDEINLLKVGNKTKFKDQLDPSILEKLYELPSGWKWVRINDLIESSTYGTSAKTNDDVSGTPVLRMGNIVDGFLNLNSLKYLPNEHEDIKKTELQAYDLLFNRTNSYELVGKTAFVTEELSGNYSYASYLIRVSLFYKDILGSYVSHYINSQIGRSILLTMVSQQVGQANINSQKLASLPIPLPPKDEIKEISKMLDQYRVSENKQMEMLDVGEIIELTKKSILSKAFRGVLGTNDPNEENAIELLEEVLQWQVK